MFWSNQDPDPAKRKNPDPNAFKPDPKTGEVDMSGYKDREQPGFVNFDYASWDEANNSFLARQSHGLRRSCRSDDSPAVDQGKVRAGLP